jgi:UDP-galactopyranose mutase
MERPYFPITSASLNQVFGRKKSKTSFEKITREKKQPKNTFSNIDDVDEKIEHCLQLAEDTFNISTYREESSNHWDLNSTELEQDQSFIKYLE